MALMDELNAQMKQSMLAKDKVTLSVVRMLKTALVNEKIKLGHDLSEEEERAFLRLNLNSARKAFLNLQKAVVMILFNKPKLKSRSSNVFYQPS